MWHRIALLLKGVTRTPATALRGALNSERLHCCCNFSYCWRLLLVQCHHGSELHFSFAHILSPLLCNSKFLIVVAVAVADDTFITYVRVCMFSFFCHTASIYERILCDDKRIKLRLCHKCAANVAKIVT